MKVKLTKLYNRKGSSATENCFLNLVSLVMLVRRNRTLYFYVVVLYASYFDTIIHNGGHVSWPCESYTKLTKPLFYFVLFVMWVPQNRTRLFYFCLVLLLCWHSIHNGGQVSWPCESYTKHTKPMFYLVLFCNRGSSK